MLIFIIFDLVENCVVYFKISPADEISSVSNTRQQYKTVNSPPFRLEGGGGGVSK